MIFSVNNYDPEEDEGRKKPAYVSAKEWRFIGIVVVFVIVLMIPVYRHFMDLRNSHVCRQNLLEISNAMEAYCDDNNDRFPPLFETAEDGYEPKIYNGNQLYSWVSLLSQYTKKPEVFACPSAQDDERVLNVPLPPVKGTIESDYGMYGALSALPRGNISSPQSEILICDSSNEGANGTSDPLPFKDSRGHLVPDGIEIGLDTSNFTPNDSNGQTFARAKYATRVATPDSVKSGFNKETYTRHLDGINVLMADLHMGHLAGPGINIRHEGKKGGIIGNWTTP